MKFTVWGNTFFNSRRIIIYICLKPRHLTKLSKLDISRDLCLSECDPSHRTRYSFCPNIDICQFAPKLNVRHEKLEITEPSIEIFY